jgi:hypothetical protein
MILSIMRGEDPRSIARRFFKRFRNEAIETLEYVKDLIGREEE